MLPIVEVEVPPSPPIVLVEYFDEHWYKVTENSQVYWIPSVTTKLGVIDKPNLGRWRGDVGNREADFRMYEAGQRGKRLHWAREILLTGGAVVYDPWQNPIYTPEGLSELAAQYPRLAVLRTQDEMWQITKLKRQLDILKPKIIGVEVKVYDLETMDAGTIDGIYGITEGEYLISGKTPVYLPGGIYIDDYKSGKYLDDNVWLQESAYAHMYQKQSGLQVAGAICTWTGATIKSGIPGLKTLVRGRDELLGPDYDAYRHADALWRRDHSEDRPDLYEFPSLITYGGETDGIR